MIPIEEDDTGWILELCNELRAEADALEGSLIHISHEIHQHPELRFEEYLASQRLQQFLAHQGFSVTSPVAGMDTAFIAERCLGREGPSIAVFCEYDALEGLGHACGHNIIAAAGAGAAVCAARWLEREETASGRIVVIGSPGEEGGGGKIRLIRGDALDGIDAALMIHPAGFDAVDLFSLGRISLEIGFTGRAAHAAAAPHLGLNALDAATLTLVGLGLLRQQIRPDSRVHAILTEGGDAVNVIPERSRLKVFARSPDHEYLRGRLETAVRDCALGAAIATGTQVEIVEAGPAYDPVRSNPILAGLAGAAFSAIGREPVDIQGEAGWSTDMGNVSQILPAIHPYICLAPGIGAHTREFAAEAIKGTGDRAVLDGATIIGACVAALLSRPDLLTRAVSSFAEP